MAHRRDHFLNRAAQHVRGMLDRSLDDQQYVARGFRHLAEIGLAHIEPAEQTIRRAHILEALLGDAERL